MTERPYLSIGEVLGLLLEEFPDITISKIRFLESQGLIEPERTASGYRKFYDADVDRLRFILREQKENYLPLKVIKDRLEGDVTPDTGLPRGIRNVTIESAAVASAVPDDTVSEAAAPTSRATSTASPPRRHTSHPSATRPAAVPAASPAAPSTIPDKLPIAPATTPTAEPTTATEPAAAAEPATATAAARSEATDGTTAAQPDDEAPSGQLSRPELLTECGIDGALLDELESFGLIVARRLGQQAVYDRHAVTVAGIARDFAEAGIEVRHLRGFKTSAERETGLYEQRILPMLRQRNPRAREQSNDLLGLLVDLGARLHAALVEQALRPHRDAR